MYDGGKIVAGLVVFVVLATTPAWYNAASGQADKPLELAKVVGQTRCIEPVETMRAAHMDLLRRWREDVVRGDAREYVASDGRTWTKSLSGTCLKCHGKKTEFCDRCHAYTGVPEPNCWKCHPAQAPGSETKTP
jgi:hypothetical protein